MGGDGPDAARPVCAGAGLRRSDAFGAATHRPPPLRWQEMIKLLLPFAIAFAGFVSAAEEGRFEDLGVQITSLTLQGTTAAKDPAGRELICTVIRGEPAKLQVFDV